jgi:hypothetical protein
MRRVELLIADSRRATENIDYSDTAGIQDSEFIRYLNDAQDRVFTAILSTHPDVFLYEKEVTVTNGVEQMDIPTDAYMKAKLKQVDYSPTGAARDYYELAKGSLKERLNTYPNEPSFYIRRNDKILIQPPPPTSSGKIRFSYFRALPKLNNRVGQIDSVTLNTGTSEITAITIDITSITTDNITLIESLGYMTLVNKDGVIQMKGIPVSNIDSTTGIVTLDGAFTYESGETAAAENWVVPGEYHTSHSMLDDSCERYLLAHCDWKILKRDSSNDSVEQGRELDAMLTEIVTAYKDIDEDVDYVPIIDTSFLISSGG